MFVQRSRKVRRLLATGALALAAAGTLAGCNFLTPTASNTDAGSEPVSTDVPDEEVTLRVADWDNSESMAMIIEAFEEKYPQVTVEHEYTEASDYQKTIKLVMQSENPPDIVQYNTPVRELGAAGLILDLTPYEEAYGWSDVIPGSLLDQTRFSDDGKTMGEGALLAAPSTVPLVGVFYNKSITEAAGVTEEPADFAEFEDALAKVEASGALPLQLGALDFGGIHNFAAVLNAHSDVDDLRSWLFGQAGADISSTISDAAATMRDWSSEGYYLPSANGTGDADAAAKFAEGSSAYLITGSWNANAFQESLGDDVGFFLLPMDDAGSPQVATASVAAFSVSAKTEHPTAAVAFLDFLYSQEAAPGVTVTGNLSLNPEGNEGFEGVNADIAEAYARLADSDGAVIFPDQSAPALLDVLTGGLQLVLAGNTTPEDFSASVQKAWSEYHG